MLWHCLVRSTAKRTRCKDGRFLHRALRRNPCKDTSEISCFKILSEAGVAAGVRRIEALTSDGLIHHYENVEQELHAAAAAAKSTPSDLQTKIESMMEEIKALTLRMRS